MIKINIRTSEPISLESGIVVEVQHSIYLGSNISTKGGADKDVDLHTSKACHAFRTLRPVWLYSQLSINTKILIFYTNVNQFFSMAVKRGKLPSLSTINSKPSSTVASDTFLRYGGLTKYQIKSSGRKPNRKK